MPRRDPSIEPRRGRRLRPLVAYLFPAVLGGGEGDLAELEVAARALIRERIPVVIYRARGRSMPKGTQPFPSRFSIRRRSTLVRDAARALTVSCDFGVTAGPEASGAFGRAGPWATEAAEIERCYGRGRVLHVSLGEFARTLTSREQVEERYREGGRSHAWIRHHLQTPRGRREIEEAHRLYVRFRALDRSEILHLFPGFRDPRAFRREFPASIPTGPLGFHPQAFHPHRPRRGPATWIWYASPSTSDRLVRCISRSERRIRSTLTIEVRSPRPLSLPRSTRRLRWVSIPTIPRKEWMRRFRSADLRIVTGTRTLLEALQLQAPFLYFNGVTGRGRSTRTHRPEKLRSLLFASRRSGTPASVRKTLSDFARLRGVARSLAWALNSGRGFRLRPPPAPYPPPYGDGAELLRLLARRFASGIDAIELAECVRGRRLGRELASGSVE